MKNPSKPVKILFFRVKDNQAKIQVICTKVLESLQQEKRLLILTPNPEAATYVDNLLWRIPEESFLPHAIINSPSQEQIAITMQATQNFNGAHRLLNLCPHCSPLIHQFEEVYELYDETHPQKIEWSKKRLQDYQAQNIQVLLDKSSH